MGIMFTARYYDVALYFCFHVMYLYKMVSLIEFVNHSQKSRNFPFLIFYGFLMAIKLNVSLKNVCVAAMLSKLFTLHF